MKKTFKIQWKNYSILIKDLSKDGVDVFMAKIPELNNSLVFSPTIKELKKAIGETIKLSRELNSKKTNKEIKKALVKTTASA